MRFIKSFIFSLFLIILLPSTILAREIIREEDGERCIDLEAAYADINDSSKALTGQDNSVDAVKRVNTVASLTNIMSILIGDSIYCVNDEASVSNIGGSDDNGLIGQLLNANSQMIASFPTVNVGQHLAEEFIPGYRDNVGIFALGIGDYEEDDLDKEERKGQKRIKQIQEKVTDPLQEQFLEDANQIIEESENLESVDTSNPVTNSGYNYLKDNLHLDEIWGTFRNIAYLGYVIIIIIVGFMIMFRKNLPGQIVVSLGNTIPQIIFGLILVTFSFAIVGIVMDVGKTSMKVIGSMFVSVYKEEDPTVTEEDLVGVEDIGSLTDEALITAKQDGFIVSNLRKLPLIGENLADSYSGTAGTVKEIVGQSVGIFTLTALADVMTKNIQNMHFDVNILGVDLVLDIAAETIKSIITLPLNAIKVGLTTFLIRNILLLLVCLYASFKLFITMLMTYLKLFINVIFGPIQIMLGSLPGNFSSTTKWFKSVIANVFTFVGIYLVINVFAFISSAVDPAQFNFFGNKGVFWPDWIVSLEGVILIAGYLFAANMPTIINGALKIEQSKEMSMVGQSVQKAAGKIPFIGGMFNG